MSQALVFAPAVLTVTVAQGDEMVGGSNISLMVEDLLRNYFPATIMRDGTPGGAIRI